MLRHRTSGGTERILRSIALRIRSAPPGGRCDVIQARGERAETRHRHRHRHRHHRRLGTARPRGSTARSTRKEQRTRAPLAPLAHRGSRRRRSKTCGAAESRRLAVWRRAVGRQQFRGRSELSACRRRVRAGRPAGVSGLPFTAGAWGRDPARAARPRARKHRRFRRGTTHTGLPLSNRRCFFRRQRQRRQKQERSAVEGSGQHVVRRAAGQRSWRRPTRTAARRPAGCSRATWRWSWARLRRGRA